MVAHHLHDVVATTLNLSRWRQVRVVRNQAESSAHDDDMHRLQQSTEHWIDQYRNKNHEQGNRGIFQDGGGEIKSVSPEAIQVI